MRSYSLFLLLNLSLNSSGQNLVPNWSFEDTVSCPDNLGQINRAMGWSSYRITPDYFNACTDSSSLFNVSVPLNTFDYQVARTGNAYGGFHSYYFGGGNVREYIGTQLIQPLAIGVKYYAACFVSRVSDTTIQHKNIATNKLGLRLSTVPFSSTNQAPINNIAQVFSDSIISDTVNWIVISGFFTADSAYEYLCVGNFFDDSVTSFVRYDSLAVSAYYFVDDVILLDSIPLNISVINPSHSILLKQDIFNNTIALKGNGINEIAIYDSIGRNIFLGSYNGVDDVVLSMREYSMGMYIIKVRYLNKNVVMKVLIN